MIACICNCLRYRYCVSHYGELNNKVLRIENLSLHKCIRCSSKKINEINKASCVETGSKLYVNYY
jgi:hypothetical protein